MDAGVSARGGRFDLAALTAGAPASTNPVSRRLSECVNLAGRPRRRSPDVLRVDRPNGEQGGPSKLIVGREHRRYRLSAGPDPEPAKDR
jgi:hypothetical protein